MNEVIRPRFLRRAGAAKYVRERWGIPCATRTLAKLACISSEGPEMQYAGRIPLYTTESLDAWALKKIGPPRRSTSDRSASDRSLEALPAVLATEPHALRGGRRSRARVAGGRSPGEAPPKSGAPASPKSVTGGDQP